jgi:hypothetical protein
MTTQTVTIQVAPQVAQLLLALQRRADAECVTLDSLLLPLVSVNGDAGKEAGVEMTPQEKADDFVRWLKDHAVKGVVADDSRESIYMREDEAL